MLIPALDQQWADSVISSATRAWRPF